MYQQSSIYFEILTMLIIYSCPRDSLRFCHEHPAIHPLSVLTEAMRLHLMTNDTKE